MSPRSAVASSGSRPIIACSAACREPEQHRRLGQPGGHVPDRLGGEPPLGHVQGDHVDRLVIGQPLTLVTDHLLAHLDRPVADAGALHVEHGRAPPARWSPTGAAPGCRSRRRTAPPAPRGRTWSSARTRYCCPGGGRSRPRARSSRRGRRRPARAACRCRPYDRDRRSPKPSAAHAGGGVVGAAVDQAGRTGAQVGQRRARARARRRRSAGGRRRRQRQLGRRAAQVRRQHRRDSPGWTPRPRPAGRAAPAAWRARYWSS